MRLEVRQPMLDFAEMAQLRDIERTPAASSRATSSTSPIRWPGATKASRPSWRRCAPRRSTRSRSGHNILIISDRRIDREHVAIPALLALSAIHQHLVREGLRTTAGLVVETGSAREVHHFALLAGYGAEAVHPYLALETLRGAARGPAGRPGGRQGDLQLRQGDRQGPVEDHVQDGHLDLHVVQRRADLRGRSASTKALVDKYFPGTATQVERHRRVRGRRGSDPHAPRRLQRRPGARRACSTPAASTPGACAAKSTCGRPTRSPSCSTRARQPLRAPTRNTRSSSTTSRARHMTLRGLFEFKRRSGQADSDRRGRAGQPRSSSASPPARCRSARSRPRRTRRSPSR